MNDDSTLSVVVLPAPVLPDTMMLSRPRTQASRKSAVCALSEPNSIRSSTVSGSAANFRMVSTEPSTASGGTTAFTRLPSGRRASTIGLDSSTRRPIRDTILSIVRRRWASSVKWASAWHQPARLLEPDAVVAVDHDLGDVRVAQVGLDRPVAEDVVADLLGDARAGRCCSGGRSCEPSTSARTVRTSLVELVLVHVGVVELRTQLLAAARTCTLRLELLEPVRLRGADEAASRRAAPERRRRRAMEPGWPCRRCSPPWLPVRRRGACHRSAAVGGRDAVGSRGSASAAPRRRPRGRACSGSRVAAGLAGGGETVGKVHGYLRLLEPAARRPPPRSAGRWTRVSRWPRPTSSPASDPGQLTDGRRSSWCSGSLDDRSGCRRWWPPRSRASWRSGRRRSCRGSPRPCRR